MLATVVVLYAVSNNYNNYDSTAADTQSLRIHHVECCMVGFCGQASGKCRVLPLTTSTASVVVTAPLNTHHPYVMTYDVLCQTACRRCTGTAAAAERLGVLTVAIHRVLNHSSRALITADDACTHTRARTLAMRTRPGHVHFLYRD